MLHRLRAIALLLLIAVLATGCYAGPRRGVYVSSHHHHRGSDGAELALAAVDLVTAVAVLSTYETERREPERIYYQPVYYGPAAPPMPASAKDRVANDETRSFDAKSARAALGAVDLAACRAEGAPRGYGHANVTFNPDGKASKVVVDTPDGLSESAVKCIGDRLGAVDVPQYDGSYITVGTTWFVR